jgi:hypothetical protein
LIRWRLTPDVYSVRKSGFENYDGRHTSS